jgi:hypothetical protein
MTTLSATRPVLSAALVAALTLAVSACSGAAAPSSPAASQPASAAPSGSPGASPTDPDSSVSGPSDPGGGGSDGGPTIVIPRPGMFDPHPVSVERIEPSIDGRHVTVKLTWTSGVEPCYVLDSVVVSRDGNDVTLTVVEGASQRGAICIEIAQQKATIVDLGELEPGQYTIAATNSSIPPVTITVS